MDLLYSEETEIQAYFQVYIAIHRLYGADLPPQARTTPQAQEQQGVREQKQEQDNEFDLPPDELVELLKRKYGWQVEPIKEWEGAYQYIPPSSISYPFEIILNTNFPIEDLKQAYYQLYVGIEENYLRKL